MVLYSVPGQIGLDPVTNELVEGFEGQAHQVLKNLTAVLNAANSGMEKVVKTTVYLVDIDDYAKLTDVYGQYFSEHKPARAAIAVAHLPKGALIEIEAIAEVENSIRSRNKKI